MPIILKCMDRLSGKVAVPVYFACLLNRVILEVLYLIYLNGIPHVISSEGQQENSSRKLSSFENVKEQKIKEINK